jgi:hypothetical protein
MGGWRTNFLTRLTQNHHAKSMSKLHPFETQEAGFDFDSNGVVLRRNLRLGFFDGAALF